FPHFREVLTNAGFHTKVVPFQEEVVRSISQTLYLLWGGALFVLMIGVINIANLALARGSVRIKELATRYALGAGRWRVTRQLLAESALLTAAGAGLGLLLGYWSLRLLRYLHIERIPRGSEISLDGSVLSFVLGLSLGAGLVIGAIPVIQGLRANLNLVFREESRSSTGGRRSRLLRGGLVVTQVAFALVLLMGAGLLIASFRQVVAVRPGFVPEQVLTGSVALPSVRYREAARQRSFMQRSLERIRALPGVIHAGATNTIPFGDDYSDSVILAEGYVMQPGESMISGDNMSVTPQYFEAMRIPLLEGRYFDESDSPDSPRVIIIDQRLARKFWPDSSPVGKRMWRPTSPEELQNPEKAEWFTVVGVVGSVKLRALVDAEERIGSYYFPLAQQPDSGLTFAVRTTADTGATMAAMRRVIAEIDPELPFYDTRTMEERIDNSLVSRRSPMLLSVCFGAVALFLAAVGIYGVLSYLVAQRTKEIGIRIALGSDSGGVFQLVFKEGLLITGIGFALGILGSWLLTRYIESVLFGVRPLDPPVLVVVCLVLGMVALSASTLPARRAARVDPITALRQE
ncbi:MAG: FtsX-like permease family protein, partial [Acidobacteria bacterium]|nr:FtsX-like permease family protein [Acidobacteriota bacterium]